MTNLDRIPPDSSEILESSENCAQTRSVDLDCHLQPYPYGHSDLASFGTPYWSIAIVGPVPGLGV